MKQKVLIRKIISTTAVAGKFISRYRFVIGIVLVAVLFAYSFRQINHYSNVDRDENRVTDGLAAIKKVKFDNVAVDKIKNLKDQNVSISPDLPQNRTNPFQ